MTKYLLILGLLAIVAIAWACKPTSDAYKTVGVDEFEQLISNQEDVVLVDVRTSSEFSEGHLRDAILIDWKKDGFMEVARFLLPKERTIAVYCRSGRRSASAADSLAADGYHVVNLDGGIIAWEKAGKEVVK